MRKTAFVIVVLLFGLQTACERSPKLAKFKGGAITEADLEELTEFNPRLSPRLATPAGKQKILESYLEQTLLYREAVRRGLHRAPETRRKLDLYKKIVIAQALLDDELDKRVQDYYQNNQDEFERVKVSHILIRKSSDKKGNPSKRPEVQAKKLIEDIQKRLKAGEDFGKLATQFSEDERSKQSEGSLGYITLRDKRLERWGWLSLGEKAFALKKEEVSEPVQTEEGYHLVKVVEERSRQPLADVEPSLRFRFKAELQKTLFDELKGKYKVAFIQPKEEKPAQAIPVSSTPPAAATPPPAQVPGAQTPETSTKAPSGQ